MLFANPPCVKSMLVIPFRKLDHVGSCPAKNHTVLIGLRERKGRIQGGEKHCVQRMVPDHDNHHKPFFGATPRLNKKVWKGGCQGTVECFSEFYILTIFE